jgi:hypothetical protein
MTSGTHHGSATRRQPRWRANLRRFWDTGFIGDWHPWIRDPLDVFRLSFGVGAVIFALQGDWDAFVRLLLPGVLVCVVRALDVPRPVDLLFCIAMFFQGWGNALHLFSDFWWYDNLVHITLPASLAPILYIGFSRLDVVPDPAERVGSKAEVLGMSLIAGCLGVTAASGYEIYEWVVTTGSASTCSSARPTRSPTSPTASSVERSAARSSPHGRSLATRAGAFRSASLSGS